MKSRKEEKNRGKSERMRASSHCKTVIGYNYYLVRG
jgi:hypothetical protein